MFNWASRDGDAPVTGRAYRWFVDTPIDRVTGGLLSGPDQNAARDCPECGVTGSVRGDVCEVCYAELDEFVLDPLDSPTAS